MTVVLQRRKLQILVLVVWFQKTSHDVFQIFLGIFSDINSDDDALFQSVCVCVWEDRCCQCYIRRCWPLWTEWTCDSEFSACFLSDVWPEQRIICLVKNCVREIIFPFLLFKTEVKLTVHHCFFNIYIYFCAFSRLYWQDSLREDRKWGERGGTVRTKPLYLGCMSTSWASGAPNI